MSEQLTLEEKSKEFRRKFANNWSIKIEAEILQVFSVLRAKRVKTIESIVVDFLVNNSLFDENSLLRYFSYIESIKSIFNNAITKMTRGGKQTAVLPIARRRSETISPNNVAKIDGIVLSKNKIEAKTDFYVLTLDRGAKGKKANFDLRKFSSDFLITQEFWGFVWASVNEFLGVTGSNYINLFDKIIIGYNDSGNLEVLNQIEFMFEENIKHG